MAFKALIACASVKPIEVIIANDSSSIAFDP